MLSITKKNTGEIKMQSGKKLILLLAIVALITTMQAQRCLPAEVPSAVTDAFSKTHPDVTDVDWQKNGVNYIAQYDVDKVLECIYYTAKGILVITISIINVIELPTAINDYVQQKYKGKEITEAYKIKDAKGVITYNAEVREMNLIFDAQGKYLGEDNERKNIKGKCSK